MRLKRKTRRRLLLLTLFVGGAIVVGTSAYVIRNSRAEARLATRRTLGLAAAQQGDNLAVLSNLGSYLRNRSADPEALLAYARARRKVEERDGRHLHEAAAVYQRYLGLRDSDQAVRLELIETLADVGLDLEVCDEARRLRPSAVDQLTAEHLPVLRLEIQARRNRKDFTPETLSLARRTAELAPDDFGVLVQYIGLMMQMDRDSEAKDFVDSVAARSPDDPRVDLLRSLLGAQQGVTREEAIAALCRVAGLDPATGATVGPAVETSNAVISVLLSGFDSLGRSDLAMLALAPYAMADFQGAPAMYARRAHYLGRDAQLVQAWEKKSDSPQWQATDVAAFTALALWNLGRTEEGDRLMDDVAGRASDFRADGWRAARAVLRDGAKAESAQAVKSLRESVDLNPVEPYLRVRLAQWLSRIGRNEDARTELTVAERSPLAAGWSRPGLLRAECYLTEGRILEAHKACRDTASAFPEDLSVGMVLLAIQIELIERADEGATRGQAYLDKLWPVLESLSGPNAPEGLSPSVRGLLIVGAVVAADAVNDDKRLKEACDLALASADAVTPDGLLRIAEISRRHALGLEQSLLAMVETSGPTPASVLFRAIMLAQDEDTDGGRELVQQAVSAPANRSAEAWQLILPQYLEVIRARDAIDAWRDLVDRFPGSTHVQLAALRARSIAADGSLVARIAERLATNSGKAAERPPLVVRLAQARALAAEPRTSVTRDKLIGMLRTMSVEAPDLIEPRLLLADVFLAGVPGEGVRPEPEAALEQLRAAAPLAPRPAAIRIRIAGLLREGGDVSAARTELAAVAADSHADDDARWTAVESLGAIGQFQQAATSALALAPAGGVDLPTRRLLTLARLALLAGRDAEAAACLRQLAARDLSADQAFEVARNLVSLGESELPTRMFERLGAGADGREFQRAQARLFESTGARADARLLLQSLLQADPADAESAKVLVASFIAEGDLNSAERVLREALTHTPQEVELELLGLEIAVRRGDDGDAQFSRMAEILERDPESRARAEAIRAYSGLRASAKANDPQALLEYSTKYASDATVQSVVVADLLRIEPPALREAAQVASRAYRSFPTRWQSSADAVRVFQMRAEWPAALDAAERWQRLTRSRNADVAVSRSQLMLNRPRQALAALEPYMGAALSRPEDSLEIIALWSHAAVRDNQASQVRRILEPIAQQSPIVLQQIWVDLAGNALPVETAASWLKAAERVAIAQGTASVLAIADGWSLLADREKARRTEFLTAASSFLEQAAGSSDATTGDPLLLCTIGDVAGELGQLDRAEQAFRAAASTPAGRSPAHRGLALIALRRGDAAAAVQAARIAAEAPADKDPRAVLVLGDSLLSLADSQPPLQDAAAEAAAVFGRLIGLVGPSPASLDKLAQAHLLSGRIDDAVGAFDQLIALPAPPFSKAEIAAGKNNLAVALVTHRKDKESLVRAKELAVSAAAELAIGPVFETVGAAQAALGERQDAITSFRRSLQLRPNEIDTMLKLAEQLAAGNAAEREEAGQLVAQVEAMPAAQGARRQTSSADLIERIRGLLRDAPAR